jgi:hypothetical protein
MTEPELTARDRPGCGSVGGRIVGTLFFGVFLFMGSIFVVLILGETVRQAAVWFWPEAPCVVIASGVAETDSESKPYRPDVLFEYQVGGRGYRGRAVARGATESASFDRARRLADRLPAGSRTTCRVNPVLPGDAVLERRTPWVLLMVPLPLIFVVIGGAGLWGIWRHGQMNPAVRETRSISQRAPVVHGLGRKIAFGIGALFTGIGGGLTIFLLIIPSARLVAAAGWLEVPATVQQSTVRSWSTDDGTSYRADVLYEYRAGSRSWLSNRRTFFPMGSSGYDGNQAIVRRYPEGSVVTCFIDPDDPSRSVLDRKLRLEYLIGLLPVLFLLAGIALLRHALRGQRPGAQHPAAAAEPADDDAAELALEPAAGPVTKIVGMIFFAAFWNGIVGIFVWQAVESFRRGTPEWFMAVFLIPFVLIGLALIGGVVYTALAAFNPRPLITISPGRPRLGSRLRVDWRFSGRAGRIRHLTVALEGHEKASYRRGTDTHTDRSVFASFELVDTSSDWEIPRGSAEVAIPEDTMHSFSAASNAVVWAIYVHGEITRWPDVEESFEIELRPLPHDGLAP